MIIGKFSSYTLGKAPLSLNSVTNQAKGGIVRGKSRQAFNFYCCVVVLRLTSTVNIYGHVGTVS